MQQPIARPIDAECGEPEREQRREQADRDLLPFAGNGDHVVIEEARQKVAEQLEIGAVRLLEPDAKTRRHSATTSKMRCAIASVSSGWVSCAKTPSRLDFDMSS